MLSAEERSLIYDHAYVPEQLPDYVEGVSGAEGCFHEAHVCYVKARHLIFVGYPLPETDSVNAKAYESDCKRFNPMTVAIVAPRLWFDVEIDERQTHDMYYRLDLPYGTLRPDLAYMVRRASRELKVSAGSFGEEHERLVNAFIRERDLLSGHQEIFGAISTYLKRSETAHLLEARRGGNLVAFNVLDLGSAEYAFWLFHFRSSASHNPGASDLLFHEMIRLAAAAGKKRLNLGLGTNAGIRRFKEKWGAEPFVTYATTSVRRKRMSVFSMLSRL